MPRSSFPSVSSRVGTVLHCKFVLFSMPSMSAHPRHALRMRPICVCSYADLVANARFPNPFIFANGTAVKTKAEWWVLCGHSAGFLPHP